MKFVMMLVALALGLLFTLKLSNRTAPLPAQPKQDFVAGFKSIFTLNCSQGDQTKTAACACILDEMVKANAIQPTIQALESHQAKFTAFLNSEPGKKVAILCNFKQAEIDKPVEAEPPSVE